MKADQITTALCILYVTLPSTTGNHSTSSKSKPTGHGPGTRYIKPGKQAERLNDRKREIKLQCKTHPAPFVLQA